jgi:hypothetical protein
MDYLKVRLSFGHTGKLEMRGGNADLTPEVRFLENIGVMNIWDSSVQGRSQCIGLGQVEQSTGDMERIGSRTMAGNA